MSQALLWGSRTERAWLGRRLRWLSLHVCVTCCVADDREERAAKEAADEQREAEEAEEARLEAQALQRAREAAAAEAAAEPDDD